MADDTLRKIREAAERGIDFMPELLEEDFRPGLVKKFFSQVLEIEFDRCFCSTESDCTDFPPSREEVIEKTREVFGIDISDVPRGLRIVDVLRRLELQ